MHAHRVVLKAPKGAPQVREVLAGKVLLDACHHAAPAVGLDQAQNRDQQRAEPDEKELQHLIEDRREQSARCDVNSDRQR